MNEYVSRSEYQLVLNELNAIKDQVPSLTVQLQTQQEKYLLLEKQFNSQGLELQQRNSKLQDVTETFEQTQNALFRRSEECDRLREQLKLQSSEIIEQQKLSKNLQIRFTDLQSQIIPKQFEASKLIQEKEYLEKELEYQRSELLNRETQERNYRKETSEKLAKLEMDNLQLKHSVEEKKTKIELLSAETTSQEEKIQTYILKLKNSEDELSQQLQMLSEENGNLKKLTNLYKGYFEEATTKLEEVEKRSALQSENFKTFSQKKQEELQAIVNNSTQLFEKEKEQLLAKISDLEAELQEQSRHHDSLALPAGGKTFQGKPYETIPSMMGDLSVTQLYDQLIEAQRDVVSEQSKRKELEINLQSILKDIEMKTPLIAKQKADYQKIIRSHTQLSETLDGFIDENNQLKILLHDAESRHQKSNKELEALQVSNNDLIQQIQYLLKANLGLGTTFGERPGIEGNVAISNEEIDDGRGRSGHDVISTHLVNFSNVDELVQKNHQLLSTTRRLTEEREQQEAILQQIQSQKSSLSSSNDASNLQDLQRELQELQCDQLKSEEMMKILVQQRDMYRSMLTTGDYSSSHSVSSPTGRKLVGTHTASPSAGALVVHHQPPQHHQQDDNAIIEAIQLKSQLHHLQVDNDKLNDRLQRFEENDKLANQELSKTKDEIMKVKLEFSTAKAELKFSQERCDRLDAQLKTISREQSDSLQRRNELEELIISYQKELRSKDDLIHQHYQDLRLVKESLRHKEIDYEVLKNSEVRYLQQISSLNEEIRRNNVLTEHLHRIESSLSSKFEEEKQTLRSEKEFLQKEYDSYRSNHEDTLKQLDTKCKIQEMDLTKVTNRLESKEKEFISLQHSLIHEQSLSKVNNDRIQQLERSNTILQERLNQLTGNKIVESVLEKELSEKDLELSKANLEIENLQTLLQKAETHLQQLKVISSTNEQLSKDLSTKQQEDLQVFENDKALLTNEIENLKLENERSKLSSQQLVQELDNLRKDLIELQQSSQEGLHSLTAEITRLHQENHSLQSTYQLVKSDYDNLQRNQSNSYENYERELQLHAESERKLREEKSLHLKTKESVSLLEEHNMSLRNDLLRIQSTHAAELERAQKELTSNKELLDNLHKSNDLLHSQILSYSSQIEKLQQDRMNLLSSASTTEGEGSSNVISDVVLEEINSLKKSSSEMRELLKFLQREKEMFLTKTSILESENARYQNQITALTKSLEEARTELKHELQEKSVLRSDAEFQILQTELQQLHILRESNLHLRREKEELMLKFSSLQTLLEKEKAAIIPLQESVKTLTVQKENLEMANDELTNDISHWKQRLHALVSRYNDIDPHEHQQLVAKYEETKITMAALEEKIKGLEASHNELIVVKDKEIASAKASGDGAEKNASNLREKLRQFKDKNVELDNKIKEMNKNSTQKDSAYSQLEQQLQDAQSKITDLTKEVGETKSSLSTALSNVVTAHQATEKANAEKAHALQQVVQAQAAASAVQQQRESAPVVAVPSASTASATATKPPPPRGAPPPRGQAANRKRALEASAAQAVTATSVATPPAAANAAPVASSAAVNAEPSPTAVPVTPAEESKPATVTQQPALKVTESPPEPGSAAQTGQTQKAQQQKSKMRELLLQKRKQGTSATSTPSAPAPEVKQAPAESEISKEDDTTDQPKTKKSRVEVVQGAPVISSQAVTSTEPQLEQLPPETFKETDLGDQPKAKKPRVEVAPVDVAISSVASDSKPAGTNQAEEVPVQPMEQEQPTQDNNEIIEINVSSNPPIVKIVHENQPETTNPPAVTSNIGFSFNAAANPFVPSSLASTSLFGTASGNSGFQNPFSLGTTTIGPFSAASQQPFSQPSSFSSNPFSTTVSVAKPVVVEDNLAANPQEESKPADGVEDEEAFVEEPNEETNEELHQDDLEEGEEEYDKDEIQKESLPPMERPVPQSPSSKKTGALVFGSGATGLFGSSSSLTNPTPSIFGGYKPAPSAPFGSGTGLFGSGSSSNSNTASTGLAGLFGAKPLTTTQPPNSIFGSTSGGGSSLFGLSTSTATAHPAGGLFGNPSLASSSGEHPPTPATSLFGGSSLFGAGQAGKPSLFSPSTTVATSPKAPAFGFFASTAPQPAFVVAPLEPVKEEVEAEVDEEPHDEIEQSEERGIGKDEEEEEEAPSNDPQAHLTEEIEEGEEPGGFETAEENKEQADLEENVSPVRSPPPAPPVTSPAKPTVNANPFTVQKATNLNETKKMEQRALRFAAAAAAAANHPVPTTTPATPAPSPAAATPSATSSAAKTAAGKQIKGALVKKLVANKKGPGVKTPAKPSEGDSSNV